MELAYTNRAGDVYHLQATSRNGKRYYSFTRKVPNEPVDALPDGHEIYERMEDGQVFLRKNRPSAILPSEKELVESALRATKAAADGVVRIEDDALVIYLPDIKADEQLEMMSRIVPMIAARAEAARKVLIARARFVKLFRFVLIDHESRSFYVERWCFLGSIDRWMPLGGSKPLAELVDTYIRHLGKPSFFVLM